MAGETIRDVLIKIRLQQAGQTKLQAPDIGPVEQAMQRASQASVDAFSKEERAAIQAFSRITAEREKAAKPLKDNLANSLSDSFGLRGGGDRQATASERDKASQAEIKANADAAASTKQRLEAYTQVGEGALRAARGVAFLTAATDDDLRAALQYVAAAQGVLDVFAGSASAIKGLITLRTGQTASTAAATTAEGYHALATAAGTVADAASVPAKVAKIGATRAETAALGAAAFAQSSLAVSTKATTAATWGQTAATIALNVALAVNPLTWALIAAGATAAGVAYVLVSKQTKETEEAIARSSKTLNDAGTDWARLAEMARRGADAITAAGEDFDTAMQRIQLRGKKQFADPEDPLVPPLLRQ